MSGRDCLPFAASLVIVTSFHVMRRATRINPAALIMAPRSRVIARAGLIDCTPLRPSEATMIVALFGRPGVAVSGFEIGDLLWPDRDDENLDRRWRSIDTTVSRCRARLAPFGLTIGRPLVHYLCSAELAAMPAMARAA